MNVFTCDENANDHIAVTALAEGVLVVITSEYYGKSVELELSSADARQSAEHIRATIADRDHTDGAAFGPLFVADGAEEDTVYVSENPSSEVIASVLLLTKDAEAFAACLDVAAADSDMLRLGESLSRSSAPDASSATTPVLTADQLTRATALACAHQVLGGRRGRVVVEAAHYILTGEVM